MFIVDQHMIKGLISFSIWIDLHKTDSH